MTSTVCPNAKSLTGFSAAATKLLAKPSAIFSVPPASTVATLSKKIVIVPMSKPKFATLPPWSKLKTKMMKIVVLPTFPAPLPVLSKNISTPNPANTLVSISNLLPTNQSPNQTLYKWHTTAIQSLHPLPNPQILPILRNQPIKNPPFPLMPKKYMIIYWGFPKAGLLLMDKLLLPWGIPAGRESSATYSITILAPTSTPATKSSTPKDASRPPLPSVAPKSNDFYLKPMVSKSSITTSTSPNISINRQSKIQQILSIIKQRSHILSKLCYNRANHSKTKAERIQHYVYRSHLPNQKSLFWSQS